MSVSHSKAEIRRQMRETRHTVSSENRKAAGQSVRDKIIGDAIRLPLNAWRVCIYLSTKSEIPTRYIARALWDAGREVCVPAWSQSDAAYTILHLDPSVRLILGYHGIREPALRVPVMPWDVDAFILPGLAFDMQGARLGFGAGHYDYILGKAPKRALKIAVAYDWQVLDTPLPQEPHDIAMDWIVTDKRVINCAKHCKETR